MAENSLSKFRTQFEKYSSMWKSLEIRAVFAFKDSHWVSLKVMAYLKDSKPTQYGYRLTFDSPNLRCVIENREIDAIWTLIDEIKSGRVHIGDIEAYMGSGSPVQEQNLDFYMSQSRSGEPPEPSFPYFNLYLSLGSVHDYIDENEINHLLYSYGYPGGLQEFSTAKIGDPVGGSYVVYFGIIAPILLIAYGESEQGYILAEVICGESIRPEDVTLRYEIYGKTEFELLREDKVVFTEANKRNNEGVKLLEKKLSIAKEASSARLMVFYKNLELPSDSTNVLIGGVKASILTAFETLGQVSGKNSYETLWDKFIRSLGTQNKAVDADAFELSIWTLLTLSGLRALHLGKAFGKGFDLPGVDLLVFADREKEIILVSCTIENKISQKIEPLLSQLNALKQKMLDWSIKGAIIAPIERQDITLGSFSDAVAADISILLKLEIQEIVDLVKSASVDTSKRTFEILTQRKVLSYNEADFLKQYKEWIQNPKREII